MPTILELLSNARSASDLLEGQDFKILQAGAKGKFVDSENRLELTEEAKIEAKEYDLDTKDYITILNIFANSQFGSSPRINQALATHVFNKYKSSVLTLEQLIANQNITKLAEKYHKYKDYISVADLLCFNTKADSNGNITKTTFVHELFKAGQDQKVIIKFFKRLNKLCHSNPELIKSYLQLTDENGKSVLQLLREQNQTEKYRELTTLYSAYPSLFDTEEAKTVIRVDTHGKSIHETVDQSLARLAKFYYPDSVTEIDENDVQKTKLHVTLRDRMASGKKCTFVAPTIQELEKLRAKISEVSHDNKLLVIDNGISAEEQSQFIAEFISNPQAILIYTKDMEPQIARQLTESKLTNVSKLPSTCFSSRKVVVNRSREWNRNIDEEIAALEKELKAIIRNDDSLSAFVIPTLKPNIEKRLEDKGEKEAEEETKKFNEELERDKATIQSQIRTTLELIDGLKKGKYGTGFAIDANEPKACGLTPKEILVLNYRAVKDREEKKDIARDQVKNNWIYSISRNQLMIQLTVGATDALRGYNIDRHGDNEHVAHGQDQHENRCIMENSMVNMGLAGHKLAEVRIIEVETMISPLLEALPRVFANPRLRADELIAKWIRTNNIDNTLVESIKYFLKDDTEFSDRFLESEIDNFAKAALLKIPAQEIKNMVEKAKPEIAAQAAKEVKTEFVFEPRKGYIISLEKIYDEDPKAFEFCLGRELIISFVAGSEGSTDSGRAQLTLEILLSSANKKLVEVTKTMAVSHLYKLPQKSKNQQLILAAESGFEHVFHALDQAGADLRATDMREGHFQYTVLMRAGYNVNIIKYILERVPGIIEDKDSYGKTAMHWAIWGGHTKIVKLLLESPKTSNVNIEGYDSQGVTVMHVAANMPQATSKKFIEMFRLLLESPKITSEILKAKSSNTGNTALHLAVINYGFPEVTGMLLKKMSRESVEAQDNKGRTALHFAITGYKDDKNTESVRLLLAGMSRESVEAQDNKGRTALDYSKGKALLGRPIDKKIGELIEARLSKKPYDLLLDGIKERDIEKVKIAIIDDVNVNAPDFLGNTPLMILADYSTDDLGEKTKIIQIAELLLKNGANVRYIDNYGNENYYVVDKDSPVGKLLIKQEEFEEKFNEELDRLCKPMEFNQSEPYTINKAVDVMIREFKEDDLDCGKLQEMFENAKKAKMAEAEKPRLKQFLESLAQTFAPSPQSKVVSWTNFVTDVTKQPRSR